MKETSVPSYSVKIFIAGDVDVIKQQCRRYCFNVGLCVTVTPTNYIYTGGEEQGVIVELINYARFPKEPKEIWDKALWLGQGLMEAACQTSFTIQDNVNSVWFSRREN